MGEGAADRPIRQWDRYWSFGSLHSFSQVSGGNYEGAIADFWRRRFADLAPGARVLDIATGNGAVPLLAIEAADRSGIGIRIDGVDLAEIDPAARVQDPDLGAALRRVRFHSRTPAESLPFADACIDLVCSQYGLEYSHLPDAVAEIARIAAPGAGVALVLHHSESALLQSADLEFEQLSFVLDEVKLWIHARNLLRAMAESGKRGRAKVERKRAALDRALQRIHDTASQSRNPRMLLGPTNYIHEILGLVGRERSSRLFELLEESRQRMLANQQRLADMKAAARDADGMETLAELFRGHRFEIDRLETLNETDGTLLGWMLETHLA